MQRALATTAAAMIMTALALGTVGCAGSPVASAPPTAHAAASGTPAAPGTTAAAGTTAGPTSAGASEAAVWEQVLRRYITTPGENSFPDPFTLVYVLNQAYPDAANPNGTHQHGAPITPQTQREVTAALADTARVVFIADRGSVIVAKNGCEQVRNGGILITLGPPVSHGQQLRVGINGFVACLGATWLTYVLRDQPGTGWRVTGTTNTMAIS